MAEIVTICNICGRHFTGEGNNPEPILPSKFKCCDECNATKVIPARLARMRAMSK